MSFLAKLFGGGGEKADVEPEIYKDFRIVADPIQESGGYRIAARIEKEIDGEMKTHHLIRADVCTNPDEARTLSAAKAKQVIDQDGDRLFG